MLIDKKSMSFQIMNTYNFTTVLFTLIRTKRYACVLTKVISNDVKAKIISKNDCKSNIKDIVLTIGFLYDLNHIAFINYILELKLFFAPYLLRLSRLFSV